MGRMIVARTNDLKSVKFSEKETVAFITIISERYLYEKSKHYQR